MASLGAQCLSSNMQTWGGACRRSCAPARVSGQPLTYLAQELQKAREDCQQALEGLWGGRHSMSTRAAGRSGTTCRSCDGTNLHPPSEPQKKMAAAFLPFSKTHRIFLLADLIRDQAEMNILGKCGSSLAKVTKPRCHTWKRVWVQKELRYWGQ